MYVGEDFTEAAAGEDDDYTLDFVRDIGASTIVSAVWTVELMSGTDPDLAAHVKGAAVWDGTKTTQRIGGLVAGCRYRLTAKITSSIGTTPELYSHVRCRARG